MAIKRKCPKCGAIVESKFCTSCGQDLTGPDIVRICPKCGTETASKFCVGCGTKLFEESQAPVKPDDSKENKATNIIKDVKVVADEKEAEQRRLQALKEEEERKRLLKEKQEREVEQRRLQALKEEEERKRLLKEKQEREAEQRRLQALKEEEERKRLLKEKQEREAEQRRLQALKEEEEKKRQLEKERKEAQEKEEYEKKKKLFEQRRAYEEALTYLETAEKTDDPRVSAKFYRKAETLFMSIPQIEDAEEKSLFAARKAKEQEIILETERIKAVQEEEEAATMDRAVEVNESEKRLVSDDIDEKTVTPQTESSEAQPMQSSPDIKAGDSEKSAGKSKSKVIIAIAAIAVIAIVGLIFGLSKNGSEEDNTASEESTSIEQDESENTAASGKFPLEIISDDNVKAQIDNVYYTSGASDLSVSTSVVNNSKDDMYIILEDVMLDDANIRVDYDGSEDPVGEGDWWISRDVSLEKIENAGATDFKELSCAIVIKLGGKELQRKEIKLKKNEISEIDVDLPDSAVDNSDKTIEVSKKNLEPTIAANERYSIDLTGCTYTKGETDPCVSLTIKNGSKQLMYVYMEDVMVDDSSIKPEFDDSEDPIQAGEIYSSLLLSLEDLQAAGVEDFKDMSFTLVVKVGDKEDLRQKIHITGDSFQEE